MKKQLKIWTIPNILSFFRIILIPFIIWTYFINMQYICVGLIILSAITDVVDGFIARHYNMVSALGKALDPIADKLTLLFIFFALGIYKPIVFILGLIFVVKEIMIGVQGLLIIKHTGTTYSAKWYGKLTTAVMYVSIITLIVWTNIPEILVYVLLGICVVLVVFSLVMYTIRNIKSLIYKNQNDK